MLYMIYIIIYIICIIYIYMLYFYIFIYIIHFYIYAYFYIFTIPCTRCFFVIELFVNVFVFIGVFNWSEDLITFGNKYLLICWFKGVEIICIECRFCEASTVIDSTTRIVHWLKKCVNLELLNVDVPYIAF